ncbi:hypothetical protein ABE169_16980 [Bacillus subtilis]
MKIKGLSEGIRFISVNDIKRDLNLIFRKNSNDIDFLCIIGNWWYQHFKGE